MDRLLQPVNRYASRRILREARTKVWHNTLQLRDARARGPAALASQLAELEVLSTARIADLTAPGQVLLRLAIPASECCSLPRTETRPPPSGGPAAQRCHPDSGYQWSSDNGHVRALDGRGGLRHCRPPLGWRDGQGHAHRPR